MTIQQALVPLAAANARAVHDERNVRVIGIRRAVGRAALRLPPAALDRGAARRRRRALLADDRRGRQRRVHVRHVHGLPVVLEWCMRTRQYKVRRVQRLLGHVVRACLWRVLVVRADDLARWPADLGVATLRARRAGQGLHWCRSRHGSETRASPFH